jgi:phosphoesterase RecJ-like protein
LGADRKDLDGISAQLLLTEGADVSVFLHETEPGLWRASMRSVNVTDVSKTASMFAGGGHIRAAGCTIRSDIKTAVRDIKDDIARQLADAHVSGT